jgi:hypothetical protein
MAAESRDDAVRLRWDQYVGHTPRGLCLLARQFGAAMKGAAPRRQFGNIAVTEDIGLVRCVV